MEFHDDCSPIYSAFLYGVYVLEFVSSQNNSWLTYTVNTMITRLVYVLYSIHIVWMLRCTYSYTTAMDIYTYLPLSLRLSALACQHHQRILVYLFTCFLRVGVKVCGQLCFTTWICTEVPPLHPVSCTRTSSTKLSRNNPHTVPSASVRHTYVCAGFQQYSINTQLDRD